MITISPPVVVVVIVVVVVTIAAGEVAAGDTASGAVATVATVNTEKSVAHRSNSKYSMYAPSFQTIKCHMIGEVAGAPSISYE